MPTQENFEETKRKAEELYKTFGAVYCPYFSEKVYFNTGGLEHLKFKHPRRARSQDDQHMRFKFLHLVPEVLRLSRTVQGIWETKHFERVRVRSRTEVVLKSVIYSEFIAVLKGVRLKIVVKQVDGGQRLFWSVIPFWGVSKETNKRKLYGGNPEED